MNLSISGKQMDVGASLGRHVEDALGKSVNKYFDGAIEGHVVFSRQGALFRCDVTIHVGRGLTVNGQGSAPEAYGAFDQAAERIDKRLRRHKRRLDDHHKPRPEPAVAPMPARQYIVAGEPEEDDLADDAGEGAPIVIAESTTDIPSLTASEAVMRLDLGDLAALMFRNAAHGGLNVVYRRQDGNIGWIDPANPPVRTD
jgi:ribosomal subunit interface protein